MAYLGCDDYCIIDNEDYEFGDNDELKQQPKKEIRQFYFVKFNRNFVDPFLKVRIERLEILNERIDRQKKSILHQIESLKEKIARLEEEETKRCYYYRDGYMHYYYRTISQHWPESVDEDPEKAMDPKVEEVIIQETIENLTYQLGHGNHKIAEEKRLLRELKHMRDKREELEHQVKEAEVQIPPRFKRDCLTTLSKYELQRKMRDCLERKRESKVHEEQKVEARKIEIREAEKRLSFMNQKQARICNRISMAQNKIDEQVSCYDGYKALMNKVDELATDKDLVALEHLSSKQVEGFMQRWATEDEFRANYNRSVRSDTLAVNN